MNVVDPAAKIGSTSEQQFSGADRRAI